MDEELIKKNQVDDDVSDEDSMNDDQESAFKNEDFDDGSIKDDILKPASTRSKIVVNLNLETFKYELDPYDKVRMQLINDRQALYKAYEQTIKELESNIKLQPKKRKMPCLLTMFYFLIELFFMIVMIYIFFLII